MVTKMKLQKPLVEGHSGAVFNDVTHGRMPYAFFPQNPSRQLYIYHYYRFIKVYMGKRKIFLDDDLKFRWCSLHFLINSIAIFLCYRPPCPEYYHDTLSLIHCLLYHGTTTVFWTCTTVYHHVGYFFGEDTPNKFSAIVLQ